MHLYRVINMLISFLFRTEILISPVSVNVTVDGSHLSTPPEISLSREEVPFLRLTNFQGQPSFDSSLAPLVKAQDISEHLSQVKSSLDGVSLLEPNCSSTPCFGQFSSLTLYSMMTPVIPHKLPFLNSLF